MFKSLIGLKMKFVRKQLLYSVNKIEYSGILHILDQ